MSQDRVKLPPILPIEPDPNEATTHPEHMATTQHRPWQPKPFSGQSVETGIHNQAPFAPGPNRLPPLQSFPLEAYRGRPPPLSPPDRSAFSRELPPLTQPDQSSSFPSFFQQPEPPRYQFDYKTPSEGSPRDTRWSHSGHSGSGRSSQNDNRPPQPVLPLYSGAAVLHHPSLDRPFSSPGPRPGPPYFDRPQDVFTPAPRYEPQPKETSSSRGSQGTLVSKPDE
jgi:hypothetical protein